MVGLCEFRIKGKVISKMFILSWEVKIVAVMLCFLAIFDSTNVVAESNIEIYSADIVWCEYDKGKSFIYHSQMYENRWSDKELVYASRERFLNPAVVRLDDDSLIVMWSLIDNGNSYLQYSLLLSEKWQVPRNFNTGMAFNGGVLLIKDIKHAIRAIWVGNNGTSDNIYCSIWQMSEWTSPEQINRKDDSPDIMPVVGLNDENLPWVVWTGFNGSGYEMFFSQLSNENKWQMEKTLSSSMILSEEFVSQSSRELVVPEHIDKVKGIGVYIQDKSSSVRSYRFFKK